MATAIAVPSRASTNNYPLNRRIFKLNKDAEGLKKTISKSAL